MLLAKTGVLGQQTRSCVQCDFSLLARHAETWIEVLAGQSDRSGRIEIRGLHTGLYRVAIIESGPGRLFAGYEDFAVKTNETTIREATAWAAYAAPLTLTLVNPPEELRGGKVEWEAGLRAEPLGPRYQGRLDNLQQASWVTDSPHAPCSAYRPESGLSRCQLVYRGWKAPTSSKC
ncbi:MAG: hypothetical protein R2748_13905 [Bryobacterales bacterium]